MITTTASAIVTIILAQSPTHQGPCDLLAESGPLQITLQQVGPYPRDATLAALRELCPAATATFATESDLYWLALDVSVGELTVLAGQSWLVREFFPDPTRPVPDWDSAPNVWLIRGCGALLPAAVSSCATWSEVIDAFGSEGVAFTEFGPVMVRLNGLPGFQLRLSVTDQVVGRMEFPGDMSRIPPEARITSVLILP